MHGTNSRQPQFAIFFLIFLMPFSRIPFVGPGVDFLRLAIFFAIWAVWFVRKDLGDVEFFRGNPLNLYFAVFTVLIGMNLLFTESSGLWFKTAAIHLLSFIYFYFFLDFFRQHDRFKTALFFFIGTSVIVSLLAIAQYFVLHFKIDLGLFTRLIMPEVLRAQVRLQSSQDLVPLGYRSMGTFFHPNTLGVYLSLVFPLCVTMVRAQTGRIERFLLSVAILLLLAAIFTSDSRGCFLSVLISMMVILVFFWARVPKVPFLVILAVGVSVIMFLYAKNPVYFRLEQLLSHRDVIWENSFKLFVERPSTGFGLGTFFQEYFPRFGFPSMDDFYSFLPAIALAGNLDVLSGFHAHNIFLQYGVEMGAVAVFWVLIFYGIVLHLLYTVWSNRERLGRFNLGVAVGGVAALCGNFVHGLFEGTTLFYDLSIALVVILILSATVTAISGLRGQGAS